MYNVSEVQRESLYVALLVKSVLKGGRTRPIKHGVDFNLVLPGEDDASVGLSRASGTPRLDGLPAIRSIRRTPASTALSDASGIENTSTRRSTRRTPTSYPSQIATSVGKRKRGADNASHKEQENEGAQTQEIGNVIKEEEDFEYFGPPSSSENEPANNDLIEALESGARNEQDENEASSKTGSHQTGRGKRKATLPLPVQPAPQDSNNEYGRVAEKAQGQDILARTQRPPVHSHPNSKTGDVDTGDSPENPTAESHTSPEDAPLAQNSHLSIHSIENAGEQAPEISITDPKKKRRKKRKAIGQQRPKPRRIPPALDRALPSRPRIEQSKESPVIASPTSDIYDNKDQTQPQPSPAPTSKPPVKRATAPRIPITIFRPPTHPSPPALDPSDSINAPIPPQPDTITSIDVLAQITRELISQTSSNPRLSDFSQRTIELYGEELDARLRTLGEIGATRKALEKRVKGLVSEEKKVRKAIAEVGRERKKVREEIELARKEGEERSMELLLKDIKGAVRKGWEKEGFLIPDVSV